MRDLCAQPPSPGTLSAAPSGRRGPRGATAEPARGEALLLLGTPREILARIVPGDPLGLRRRVARELCRRVLVADADRVLLRAYALCAYRAAGWRGRPALSRWLDERAHEALREVVAENESGQADPADAFTLLAGPLGLDPATLRLACTRFNDLGPDERATASAWLEERGLAPCFLP